MQCTLREFGASIIPTGSFVCTVSVGGSLDHEGVLAGACVSNGSSSGVGNPVSATEPDTAANQKGSPTNSTPVAASTDTVRVAWFAASSVYKVSIW